MKRKRFKSPVRVGECFPWPFKPRRADEPRKICRWVCDAPRLRAAEFVDRHNTKRTAVLHPSTKRKGWQVSFFDQHGAVSDVIRAGCDEALYDAGVRPASWKLKAVE